MPEEVSWKSRDAETDKLKITATASTQQNNDFVGAQNEEATSFWHRNKIVFLFLVSQWNRLLYSFTIQRGVKLRPQSSSFGILNDEVQSKEYINGKNYF